MTGKAFIKGCPGYKENPTENDMIHCVVLFVNAQTFSVMDENLKRKIKDIRTEADGRRKQNIFLDDDGSTNIINVRSLPSGDPH